MKVLVMTHMYPSDQHPENGIFVQQQVTSLRQEGIEVDVLHVDVKKTRWLYPWSFVPFLRSAYAHDYDIVHAHYVFAGIVARSQFRSPVVLTHHGDEAFFGWQAHLCWLTSRLVEKTIVVTDEIKKAISLSNAVVIPCGVDFDLFKPMDRKWAREQLKLPMDKKLALFVGNYPERRKRFDLVQEAVSHVRNRGMDIELIVGYKQPYDKVPIYMNACDVLVLPSDREGSPQVVKEAMACNLPVISADVGDVVDVLAGVKGCYVCQRRVEDIAGKLVSVLEKPQRTNGREMTRRYELGAIAKQIVSVYQELLSIK